MLSKRHPGTMLAKPFAFNLSEAIQSFYLQTGQTGLTSKMHRNLSLQTKLTVAS